MNVTLEPVRVDTGIRDEEGRLVFADGQLVAVLVRLSDQHEDAAGQWFYEIGFGRLDGPKHPTFADLDGAQEWVGNRLQQVQQSGSSKH